MEEKAKIVVGMTGGQATNSFVAGQVEGGMGNTYHAPQHHVEKTFHNNMSGSSGVTTVNEVTGNTVNIGSGSNPTQQPVSQATSTRSQNITNQDNTGNMATGDNHSGAMSASVHGPTSRMTGKPMATFNVTGVAGRAKVKNSSVAGIQGSDKGLQIQKDISKMEVTGVKDDAEVDNSVVAGINEGQMGSIENRQQTYNIGNAQGVVGGQDMRGASVNQGGFTGGRSGHSAYFEGKELADITEEDIVGLLREKKLAKHIQLFQEKGIDGDLLSQLTDGELIDFGIGESFERKKILNLKKCLPK
ncbi:uncharacterized protein [Haliotis asinina]|uniref:uncharacterized protein n=1 Tax=Haliotis asinina TaxID=109174 RepID=UPI003531877C